VVAVREVKVLFLVEGRVKHEFIGPGKVSEPLSSRQEDDLVENVTIDCKIPLLPLLTLISLFPKFSNTFK
jgi:hypothetical protein